MSSKKPDFFEKMQIVAYSALRAWAENQANTEYDKALMTETLNLER